MTDNSLILHFDALRVWLESSIS